MNDLKRPYCLVNLIELDPPRNGGVSRVAQLVSRSLARQFEQGRIDVYFAVNHRFAAQFEAWVGTQGLQVIPCLPEEGFTPFFTRLSPDVIISPLFGMFPFSGERNPYPDVSHIVSMPDALALDMPELFTPEERQRRRLVYQSLREAVLVITLSEHARQRLMFHLNLRPDQVKVISLGADIYEGKMPALPGDVAAPYVFYPANGWPHKRHDLLFQSMMHVWEKRPEVRVVLTGWFPDGYLEGLMEKYGCPPEKVIVLNYVSDDVVVSLYRHAEALLFVSAHEGFGMPVVEAMLNDCPVICAPVTSLPEVAGNAAIYVSEEDPERWARAFLEELPSRRQQLIEQGREQAARFRWERTQHEWEQSIASMLGITFSGPAGQKPSRDRFSLLSGDLIAWGNRYFKAQLALEAKEKVIQEQAQMLQEQAQMLQEQAQMLQEKDQMLQEQAQMLQEKDQMLQEQRNIIFQFQNSRAYWLQQGPFRGSRILHFMVASMSRIHRLITPRLGILNQYSPRPLYTPAHYRRRITVPRDEWPVISIVTPSYNQAGFLPRTIESVLGQEYPRLEYIIQDGASTDGTPDILEKYRGRLAHVESSRDNGQAHAINLGFRHANGEILAYLNSDDLLLPGALHYVADYFRRHPEVDVIYGHRVIVNEHDEEIGRWVLPPHNDHILFWADYVPQESLFWRRGIWEKIGARLDESYQFALDWDLLLRFVQAGARIRRVPRFLAAFRVHPRQKTSARIDDLGTEEMGRIREKYLGRAVTQHEVDATIRPYLRRSLLYHYLYRLRLVRY
jgi:glycosyltransferase involved in cell wall biosynthesis